jgi:tetratricopeptide (TPR) repeat protein
VEQGSLIIDVALSPDGKTILTGAWDRTARLWDVATGKPIGPPLLHWTAVGSVTFSPDGQTLLTGSFDKTARLWDAQTGRPIGQPLEHPDEVDSVAFSRDGKTILTGCGDHAARLWDTVTGQPIGPPMLHGASRSRWLRAAFSPDGRFVLANDLRTVRLWDVPAPLPDDVPRLAAWVETATGMELDERGSIHVLERAVWLERRSRLEQLGGPPPPDPASRLDPILYGADPAARGDAWKQRGHWDRAEKAYAEAIRARPFERSIWDALARLHAERGRLDRAAATLADAVGRMPEDAGLRRRWGLALLGSGDLSGWRVATAALLDRLGSTINPRTASDVAWACASGPDATGDPDRPLRLAEAAVEGADELIRAQALRTLGAALYRAGRCDEAILRLAEGIQARGGEDGPADWAFLAMAHHRLGHRAEARRWLDRLREHSPSEDPVRFWDELEIRVLRSEAEAMILDDPVFPSDPFAH